MRPPKDTKTRLITALEVQARNRERVNLFLDGEFAFSVSQMDAARLRSGQALTAADVAALQAEGDISAAIDSAVRLLAHRPRSIAEIQRNLARKGVSQQVVDATVERLSAMGYLDDAAFARFWVEDRNRFRPRGPKALRFELRQKGVDDAVIDEALTQTLDAAEAAHRAAYRHASRLKGMTRREFRARVGAFLQRRGFSHDTTQDVVARLLDELHVEETASDVE